MDTYIGMTYTDWRKEQGAKSETQRESERQAAHRDAYEGMTNRAASPEVA